MDFQWQNGPAQRSQKGLIKVSQCPIANESINLLLKEVIVARLPENISSCVIRSTKCSSTISFGFEDEIDEERVREFAKSTSAENVVIARLDGDTVSTDCYAAKGSVIMKEDILGKEFCFHSQGFFQNNTAVAEKMAGYVSGLFGMNKDSVLLDLYGGVGTFGVSLAGFFKEVQVIESFKEGIECAQKNIDTNHAINTKALCMDSQQVQKLKLKEPYVITDPPRSGMADKAIERLIATSPKAIAYISCNPEQLRRELNKFKGYSIRSIAMFDMFPQTNHLEAIALLKKIIKKITPVKESS
jgi:tRNA/tmRNA/rRNA uracil-C5-methylase (TrmA/RlmC/RlmD family)